MSAPFGFLNIDKPLGMTSHDVVHRLRRGLGIGKVGHAGTLDPLATGVLVVCVGAAARLSDFVMHGTKRYRAKLALGATTATYDAEGEILERHDAAHITRAQVEGLLPAFSGTIAQLPPMYSAIKQGGRKLYALARAGQTVERTPRQVTIHALTLTAWQPPTLTLDVTCSAGTYIRSLAHDLGAALGVGAYLAALTRTASGGFTLEAAHTLDRVVEDVDWQTRLISPFEALPDWRVVTLDAESAAAVGQGRAVGSADAADDTLAFASDAQGRLLAVVRAASGRWLPDKVFVTGEK